MAPQPGTFPSTIPGPHISSSRLPLGTWNVLANGRTFKLEINAVQGNQVDAEFSSGDVADAKWDPGSGKLVFTRVLPILKQEFTGYLLHFNATEDPMWRIAGTFGDVDVGEQSGWYATMPR